MRVHRLPQAFNALPLFDWAESRERRPATAPGRWLARRFRVRPGLADAIANANGLGVVHV